jgi:CBS domain-containing protein
MRVKEILAQKGNAVWTISPAASAFDALKLMSDKDIGALVVVEDVDLVGILSERDVARKIILMDGFAKDTTVRELMSTRVFGVRPETTAEECMAVMTELHLRHLPVQQDERIVGIVSIGDIVKTIIVKQKIAIADLKNYIMGR